MFKIFVPSAILHGNADGSLVSNFYNFGLDDALVHEQEQNFIQEREISDRGREVGVEGEGSGRKGEGSGEWVPPCPPPPQCIQWTILTLQIKNFMEKKISLQWVKSNLVLWNQKHKLTLVQKFLVLMACAKKKLFYPLNTNRFFLLV